MEVIRYLLRQPAYRQHMTYKPYKLRRKGVPGGLDRVYTDVFNCNWAARTQKKLPPGATLVPVICASDKTQLTKFQGDKKAWPLYPTIGNIAGRIRTLPGKFAYVKIALLPAPIKHPTGAATAREKAEFGRKLREIIDTIMAPLKEFDPEGPGELMPCSDGQTRRIYPIMCSWLADHEEHTKLLGLKPNACPKCTTPKDEFEDYIDPDELEDRKRDERTDVVFRGMPNDEGRNLWGASLWGFPLADAYELHRPDLLHNMQIGLLKYIMDWIEDFLLHYKRLDEFDKAWKSSTHYPGFMRPSKKYREVSQWTGKERLNLSRLVLATFASALVGPEEGQEADFGQALRCVRALMCFTMVAYYKCQDDDSIALLDTYLRRFHIAKEVFRKYRRTKAGNARVEELMIPLRAQLETEVANFAATHTAAQTRNERQRLSRALAERELELFQERGEFNFVKMHLMNHFGDSIRDYGPLNFYNTDCPEQCHRIQVKDVYARTNKNAK